MVANTELQRVGLSGWRTGLGNLVRKENRGWWASGRQLVQSLLWAGLINGLVALMVFVLLPAGQAQDDDLAALDSLAIGTEMLFKLGLLALACRTIVLSQDEIVGERQLGITEWLLSKPVSRPAYVLSKLLAHGLGVLAIMVGIQGAVGYGLMSLMVGKPFPLPAYLVGVAGLAVHTLFYLALTLMMGVLTANRRVLLGVSQGVLFGGALLAQFLGTAAMVTPWGVANILPAAVLGLPLPLPVWLPIGATAALAAGCVAVAVARFQRLEF